MLNKQKGNPQCSPSRKRAQVQQLHLHLLSLELPSPSSHPLVVNRYINSRLRGLIKQLRDRTRSSNCMPRPRSTAAPITPAWRKRHVPEKDEEEEEGGDEGATAKEGEVKVEEARREADGKMNEEDREGGPGDRAAGPAPPLSGTFCLLRPLEEKLDAWLGETLDPFTDRRYLSWLGIVTLAFGYNIWLIPARAAFRCHTECSAPLWFCCDLLADTVYVVDMLFIQPRLQFVKGGDVIVDRIFTTKNYQDSTRFKTDLMAILPFELLYLQFGFMSVFRANRMLRLRSFFEFSDLLESMMTKTYIWRVIRTIGYLLFILHLDACLYYTASEYEGVGSTQWVYNGEGSAYLQSFLYAEKSLLMIAELPLPDTLFGLMFQMMNYFIGAAFLSTFLAQMRVVISAATAHQTYFRKSMDNAVTYMNTNKIPKLVQDRVRTWYMYTWESQGMLDESELLEQMPLVMRTAIAVDINLSTFQKIDLFKGCEGQMLVDMLLRLKPVVYLPGDFVCKKGNIGKEMYIIKAGAVQVVGGDNETVLVTLKAGCVFGEISLLQSAPNGGNRRTANVIAHGFANLFVLDKKDLNDILVHYPESQKVLARKGRKLLMAKDLAGRGQLKGQVTPMVCQVERLQVLLQKSPASLQRVPKTFRSSQN
ncbi:cyclic nucleotide-gated channel beta-3-like isoform X1 [Paramormyrops kingsleyae]|uniref:cyclic nucleotide-gated channel beta-3-like isoform X1 n=1 Tax=Paramormyrops kingsleyae TaxID=1676925 RepID=UPI000CD5E7DB|nr:cyclic nucleotide-gated cation channel beta-3-like isoform X2 [Paramormyrops kingsleyae]